MAKMFTVLLVVYLTSRCALGVVAPVASSDYSSMIASVISDSSTVSSGSEISSMLGTSTLQTTSVTTSTTTIQMVMSMLNPTTTTTTYQVSSGSEVSSMLGTSTLQTTSVTTSITTIQMVMSMLNPTTTTYQTSAVTTFPSSMIQNMQSSMVQNSPSAMVQNSPSAMVQNSPSAMVQNSPSAMAQNSPSAILSSMSMISSLISSMPQSTPLPTQISSPSGCNRQVDQVSIEVFGVVTEEILSVFREEVINETNIYCSGQNRTLICQLPPTFFGIYTFKNFIGCYFAARLKRRQTTSVIRYYITQPDNSSGIILNLNAMLEITNRSLPSFTAATGLSLISVTGIMGPQTGTGSGRQTDVAAAVGGTLGSVIFILVIIFASMVTAHLIIHLVTKNNKKKKNRVSPGSDSSDDSLNKDVTADTIHLTQ